MLQKEINGIAGIRKVFRDQAERFLSVTLDAGLNDLVTWELHSPSTAQREKHPAHCDELAQCAQYWGNFMHSQTGVCDDTTKPEPRS